MLKRRLLLLLVAVASTSAALQGAPRAGATEARYVVFDQIEGFRRETWRWQGLMGLRRTPSLGTERAAGPAYRNWVRELWRGRAVHARRQAGRPPHRNAWRCLQRYEAPWHAATGNGYYGGLQMDIGFQSHYGADLLRRKGTANRWTVIEQMWVAERALRAGRGFYPWPNTARMCGLL